MLSDDGSKLAEVPESKALLFLKPLYSKEICKSTVFILMLLKKKYHPLGENCKKKLIFLKSYIFLHRNDTLLNHNSHAENTARSYMQERGECVSWVYRRQKVSPKFL